MRSHTTVAGWVMGLLDHFGITRTTAPARLDATHPTSGVCVYSESTLLPKALTSEESWFKQARQQRRMLLFSRAVIPRSSNNYMADYG